MSTARDDTYLDFNPKAQNETSSSNFAIGDPTYSNEVSRLAPERFISRRNFAMIVHDD